MGLLRPLWGLTPLHAPPLAQGWAQRGLWTAARHTQPVQGPQTTPQISAAKAAEPWVPGWGAGLFPWEGQWVLVSAPTVPPDGHPPRGPGGAAASLGRGPSS